MDRLPGSTHSPRAERYWVLMAELHVSPLNSMLALSPVRDTVPRGSRGGKSGRQDGRWARLGSEH
jgi:hypothetical protein